MNKYENGKIYKITSKQTDDVYIGSTIHRLTKRRTNHLHESNQCLSRIIMKYNDAILELIELYPCKTKQELLWRERYWIENIKCVNICIPIKTKQEQKENKKKYSEAHKEYNREYKKKLREQNIDAVRAWDKARTRFKRSHFGKLCRMF